LTASSSNNQLALVNLTQLDENTFVQTFDGQHLIVGADQTLLPLSLSLTVPTDDINAFMASNLAASDIQEEVSEAQAKEWYHDSLVAYRAMSAFKKTTVGSKANQKKVHTVYKARS
jgi:hypothetical protein